MGELSWCWSNSKPLSPISSIPSQLPSLSPGDRLIFELARFEPTCLRTRADHHVFHSSDDSPVVIGFR